MFRKIVFVTMFSLFALCFQQAQGMDSKLPKGDNLTFHNIESIECLALNIYFEARTESVAGQAAVADVVMNRGMDERWPNTVCSVIKQGPISKWWKEKHGKEIPIRNRCQFSWFCDGKSDKPKNQDAWIKARDIAYSLLVYNKYRGLTEGATHYHADYVNPKWSKHYTIVGSIGRHIYYRAD